jgi:hypothetical protein
MTLGMYHNAAATTVAAMRIPPTRCGQVRSRRIDRCPAGCSGGAWSTAGGAWSTAGGGTGRKSVSVAAELGATRGDGAAGAAGE